MNLAQIIASVTVMGGLSGSLAVLLVLVELVFANYGDCQINVNSRERLYTVKGGEHLLASLNESGLFLPSACGGKGSCGFCRCKVISGAGPVLPTEIPYLSETEISEGMRLACQVKVRTDLEIMVPEDLLNVRDYICEVESITDLTYDIKQLRLKLPSHTRLKFKAGQYMQLVAPPYEKLKSETYRAYSISSPPSQNESFELMIRYVPEGILTTYVFNHLKQNQPIRAVGPYGDFYLRDTEREIICIAGGSGFAPIRSIILDMIDRQIESRSAVFFFGARTLDDLFKLEEFNQLQQKNKWFKFVPCLSAESRNHPYTTGNVVESVKHYYKNRLDNHEAYLCGSPGMIDACVKTLGEMGISSDLIYYDKFA